jgi:hypothetical protein
VGIARYLGEPVEDPPHHHENETGSNRKPLFSKFICKYANLGDRKLKQEVTSILPFSFLR